MASGETQPAIPLGDSGGLGERIDDAVDHLLDQHLVVALAHHADHRLGAGRADDQPAVAVEALLGHLDGRRTLAFSSGLPLL